MHPNRRIKKSYCQKLFNVRKTHKFHGTRSFTTEEEILQGNTETGQQEERHDQRKHIMLMDLFKNPSWNLGFGTYIQVLISNYHTPTFRSRIFWENESSCYCMVLIVLQLKICTENHTFLLKYSCFTMLC